MANIQRAIKKFVGPLNLDKRRVIANRKREYKAARDLVVTAENRSLGLFDPGWYALQYPDVSAEGMDPFRHYLLHGYLEARNPGPQFDTVFYHNSNPDVVAAGKNPLLHYLMDGRKEGRPPNARAVTAAPLQQAHQIGEVRHVIVKEMNLAPGQDAAVLVSHAPAGRLKPHVLPYLQLLRDSGFEVLLVVVVDRPLELLDAEMSAAAGIIVRDNGGYDFAAWPHAFQLVPMLYGAGLLIMTNDSIIPASRADAFRTMIDCVRRHPADIVGLTSSHEYGWHIQSYFLAFKPKALSSWGFQHFIRDIRRIDDKDEVIRTYEVPFTGHMQSAGLSVAALYTGLFSANPTYFSWRDLLAQHFPFVKVLTLKREFSTVDEWTEDFVDDLEAAGFDIALLRAVARAAEISDVPLGPERGLLVDGTLWRT